MCVCDQHAQMSGGVRMHWYQHVRVQVCMCMYVRVLRCMHAQDIFSHSPPGPPDTPVLWDLKVP